MEIPLVNNFGWGSYSPCGTDEDSVQHFILIRSNCFLLREGQANHAMPERQEKWSQSSKFLWAKSIDEKSELILPLYCGKKLSEVIHFFPKAFLLCDGEMAFSGQFQLCRNWPHPFWACRSIGSSVQ